MLANPQGAARPPGSSRPGLRSEPTGSDPVSGAYLLGAGFFVALWALAYALVPRSRPVLLACALACAPAGPLAEYWHLQDYWHPQRLFTVRLGLWAFGVEDVLFAAAFGGLSAAIFDLLVRRRGEPELPAVSGRGALTLLGVVLGVVGAMGLLARLLGLNSLDAIVAVFAIGAAGMLWPRPRWRAPAVLAGLASGLLMWLFYWGFFARLFPGVLEAWWEPAVLSGTRLAGVPIEEVVWGAAAGFFIGPVARYCLERGPGEAAPLR